MDLLKMAKDKRVLLAAHRGVCGGNIPCNSIQAFKAALNAGADIIELDVDSSSDGVLFIQHPKMEKVHIGVQASIRSYPADMVRRFRKSNWDLAPTEWFIPTLEEAFSLLKGKCVINVDKFWDHPKEIAEFIRKMDMADQILIKTANKPEYLDAVEEYAPDIPYMTIAKEVDDTYDDIRRRKINYIGAEVLFKTDDAQVCSREYIDGMHADGKIVWANAILYSYKAVLAAGHSDDISLIEDPELGWGWLADRGFDIIQTDHLFACRSFLEATGRRNK